MTSRKRKITGFRTEEELADVVNGIVNETVIQIQKAATHYIIR